LNPLTGEWLTARKNSTRVEDGKVAANQRVFFDFTFSPPKSVSVVALYQDVRIIELHERAVGMAVGVRPGTSYCAKRAVIIWRGGH
jgi:conjugative relaxase-like TrwC/TraI family protein